MSKKMMLLALSAISAAMLAVPAFASALPAHLSVNPGNFTLHGGASALSRVGGGGTTGTTTTGTGKFENTTTGTVTLTFHGVKDPFGGSCNSPGQPAGTVVTTTLPFHLVMLGAHKAGLLITSAAGNHFVSYTCIFVPNIVVGGNPPGEGEGNPTGEGQGILGEITSPTCGTAANEAKVKFNGANGIQAPTSYTGGHYTLISSVNGGIPVQSAMNAEATIKFGVNPTLICT
ncbi:MAG TPA: hypothetical protein VJU14_02095 [Solirubrobacterales bacterium]|nr:hypothetical protein [Solirubrobacterales bacterium]